MVCLLERVWVP
ncbi:hypothetical protein E2C01_087048 [Portunus trituberculatus]|uniref:Uncharacterized protein n=1 Tax=Portunus trituberculatus TaxID=210409 RepID=A0A5B7J2D7_PORTR|nr:hypothetical protein [Portunus trituberculatus]